MSIINNIVSKEEFTKYLVEGITIPAQSSTELYDFAERLIRFINLADNTYWAAFHMSKPDTIIVDHKNIEIANIELAAGKLTFLMPPNGAAQERPKDYGHIAEGVVLFSIMEQKGLNVPKTNAIPRVRKTRVNFDVL